MSDQAEGVFADVIVCALGAVGREAIERYYYLTDGGRDGASFGMSRGGSRAARPRLEQEGRGRLAKTSFCWCFRRQSDDDRLLALARSRSPRPDDRRKKSNVRPGVREYVPTFAAACLGRRMRRLRARLPRGRCFKPAARAPSAFGAFRRGVRARARCSRACSRRPRRRRGR